MPNTTEFYKTMGCETYIDNSIIIVKENVERISNLILNHTKLDYIQIIFHTIIVQIEGGYRLNNWIRLGLPGSVHLNAR